MRNTYIYTETKKLIKKYGTRNSFEIMDQMNIAVGETSRYKTLKGYCFMSCKTIYVMISSFLSEEEKMIVAAHELGHIILHRSQLKMAPMQDDTLYNMTDNTEYQANLFAADLLIEDLTNYMCFIVLSVEIFSILFTFGVVKSVVVLLFVDTAIFIGLLVVGLVKMDLRGKEVL